MAGNEKPKPPIEPTPTPIHEEKDLGKLEEKCNVQDRSSDGAMNADVAVSETHSAISQSLPSDEQAYFAQQEKERTGQV